MGLFTSDGEFCFVAERDGRVVGFALGSLIDKRESAWTYGYLTWLAVDQAYKRGGIASQLMEAITEAYLRAGARTIRADRDGEAARVLCGGLAVTRQSEREKSPRVWRCCSDG